MTKLFILLTAFALFSCGGDSNSGSITAPESLATENASSPESTPSAADPTAFTLMSFRDLETGTIWNLRGEATSGELAGAQLEQLPAYNDYWFAWASFWPATAVLGESGSGRLAADTFKALPISEYAPDAGEQIVVVHQQNAQLTLAFPRQVNGRLLNFELVE